jgi:hypothetical protein
MSGTQYMKGTIQINKRNYTIAKKKVVSIAGVGDNAQFIQTR